MKGPLNTLGVLLLAAAAWLPVAATNAADHPVAGASLRMKDKRTLRDGVPRIARSLRLQTGDPELSPPSPGSPADPSAAGATLYLHNAGGTGESARIVLDAAGWSGSEGGWRYRRTIAGEAGTAVLDVELAAGRLGVRLRDKSGLLLRYTLDEPAQGSVGVVLELGAGAERFCLQTAALPGRDAGAAGAGCSVRGSFQGSSAGAPPACPDLSSAPSAHDTCDSWQLLDLLIESQMEATGIPGLAAAIVVDGEPMWSGGYGQRHVGPSRPVLADTPFMLASISKTVTATAVLQLVEDGVFALDDDIDSILDFAVDNPRVAGDEQITVRHLLTHTSGLADDETVWGGFPGEPGSLYVLGDSPIPLRDFLSGYFTAGGTWYDPSRNFTGDAPGTAYLYSNLATALLGYLVEAATGTPLDDHSDARIFTPLSMTDTGWHLADFAPSDVAMPYESFGGELYQWGLYGYPDYPDGQLRASVQDLARFLAAWASGGILDGQRILETATVSEALQVQLPAIDSTQALSWYYDRIGDRTVVGHNGSDYGVTTDMFFDPATRNGVVVLINTDDTSARVRAMQRIADALFAVAEEQ